MIRKEVLYAVMGGCVGAVLTMVVNSFPPLGAQSQSDGNFGKITCREIEVLRPDGLPGVRIATGKHNGFVNLGSVMIYGTDHTGFVGVFAGDKKSVSMSVDKDNGERVSIKNGESGVVVGIAEHGGFVRVVGKDSKPIATMGDHEHGGYVAAYGKNEKSSAGITIDNDGGRLSVIGKDGKEKAAVGVSEHGNGAVNTWDKNGYRLGELR